MTENERAYHMYELFHTRQKNENEKNTPSTAFIKVLSLLNDILEFTLLCDRMNRRRHSNDSNGKFDRKFMESQNDMKYCDNDNDNGCIH